MLRDDPHCSAYRSRGRTRPTAKEHLSEAFVKQQQRGSLQKFYEKYHRVLNGAVGICIIYCLLIIFNDKLRNIKMEETVALIKSCIISKKGGVPIEDLNGKCFIIFRI